MAQYLPQTPEAQRVWERILFVVIALALFLMLASVFTPGHSHGDDPFEMPTPIDVQQQPTSGQNIPINAIGDVASLGDEHARDPHAGLVMLGSLAGADYEITIYGTHDGPRYTVQPCDRDYPTAILLTYEQLGDALPGAPMPDLAGASTASHRIMYADPARERGEY